MEYVIVALLGVIIALAVAWREQATTNSELVHVLEEERGRVETLMAAVAKTGEDLAGKDALIARKRADNEALGRRLGNCQKVLSRLTPRAAEAAGLERRLGVVNKTVRLLAEERDELLARLEKLDARGGTWYVELEIPGAAYDALKADVIAAGGKVYAARDHSDEMGG